MTQDAQNAIFAILYKAQDKIDTRKANGVFWILTNIIDDYFAVWGWTTLGGEALWPSTTQQWWART